MDPPGTDLDDVKPQIIEQVKEGGPFFHCELFDSEIVHKIAQEFLPGLASACVDNTTGGLLSSPATVAVNMRREMVEYLTDRSEKFVAESVLEGGPETEVSDHPYDIISDFIDDFATSKRNFFSRVSAWLLSDKREDKIDDFVQEMDLNGFWLLGRRESVAQTLLKNVDFKNLYHCNMQFNSAEELAEHSLQCSFRTVHCANEGCNCRFSAAQMEQHDLTCPFKIIPCEQGCSQNIMRREMDRHCITVCQMKLVNCPFYSIGCQSVIPQSTIDQHRSENLSSHLLYILQVIHKELSLDDVKGMAGQMAMSSHSGQLAVARDVRSLTFAIKDLVAKLEPLGKDASAKVSEEGAKLTEIPDKVKHAPSESEEDVECPAAKEEDLKSHTRESDYVESPERDEPLKSPAKMDGQLESSAVKDEDTNSTAQEINLTELPNEENTLPDPPTKKINEMDSPARESSAESSSTEDSKEYSVEEEEQRSTLAERDKPTERIHEKEEPDEHFE